MWRGREGRSNVCNVGSKQGEEAELFVGGFMREVVEEVTY